MGSGSSLAGRSPEVFAPDDHGPRKAARREHFGTVANAAGGRGQNTKNGFCDVFKPGKTGFLVNYLFSQKTKPAIWAEGTAEIVARSRTASGRSLRPNRQPARRKASLASLSPPHASERSEAMGVQGALLPGGCRAAPCPSETPARRGPAGGITSTGAPPTPPYQAGKYRCRPCGCRRCRPFCAGCGTGLRG